MSGFHSCEVVESPLAIRKQGDTRYKQLSPSRMSSATSFRQLIGVQPSTASVADSTLIIIDAQNEYAEGKLKCSNTASSRKVIASLLQKYRQGNGKVVHVVHDTPDGAPVFTPGTKLAEEFEELAPKEGEKVIHKNYPSSFAGTDLHKHLGGGKIVLTGYMVCSTRVLLFLSILLTSAGACLCVDYSKTGSGAWLRCGLCRGCDR